MRGGLSDVTVERDERNRPITGHGVTEGGRNLGFTVQARRTVADTVSVELVAWEGSSRPLRMDVEIVPDRRISLRADCPGLALEWTMDFSTIRGVRLAHITGQVNGRLVHGDFDYLDETTTVDVSLDHWLPESLKERVSGLGPSSRPCRWSWWRSRPETAPNPGRWPGPGRPPRARHREGSDAWRPASRSRSRRRSAAIEIETGDEER